MLRSVYFLKKLLRRVALFFMVLRGGLGGCVRSGRREVTHTITCFGRKCGYSRSIITSFTSLCSFARRRTLRVSTSFKNNVNHVQLAYNTIYKVFRLIKLRITTVRNDSQTAGSHGCTVMRRLTRGFGSRGKSVYYKRLLKLGHSRPIVSRTRPHARTCCTGHPYPGVVRSTTEVFTRCLRSLNCWISLLISILHVGAVLYWGCL